jgi:hypothetical protein
MRTPTKMPDWLERQFENAERIIAGWSPGKRKAARIPILEEDTTEELKYTITVKKGDLVSISNEGINGLAQCPWEEAEFTYNLRGEIWTIEPGKSKGFYKLGGKVFITKEIAEYCGFIGYKKLEKNNG